MQDPAPAEPHPPAALGHVLYVPVPRGYGIEERDGNAPSRGTRVELGERGGFVVNRVGRSPLPRDARECAYLMRPPR